MLMNNYKNKYLIYKIKYLNLKKQYYGGSDKITERKSNFKTIKNNGIPNHYNGNDRFSNQCLFISIMDYFRHVRNQEYFIYNGEHLELNIQNIRKAAGLNYDADNSMVDLYFTTHIDDAYTRSLKNFLFQLALENNLQIRFFSIIPNTQLLANIDYSELYGEDSENTIDIVHYGIHFELIIESEYLNIPNIDKDVDIGEFNYKDKKLLLGNLSESSKANEISLLIKEIHDNNYNLEEIDEYLDVIVYLLNEKLSSEEVKDLIKKNEELRKEKLRCEKFINYCKIELSNLLDSIKK